VAQAIRVTLPEHGRKLDFARSLQVDPNVVMTVDFKSFSGVGARRWLALGIVLGLLIIYRVIVVRIRARSNAA
jgi:hypothetical protein